MIKEKMFITFFNGKESNQRNHRRNKNVQRKAIGLFGSVSSTMGRGKIPKLNWMNILCEGVDFRYFAGQGMKDYPIKAFFERIENS